MADDSEKEGGSNVLVYIAVGIAMIIAIVAIVLAFVIKGPQGPQGTQGTQGDKGDVGTTSLLNGLGPPTTQGIKGDFYIDTDTYNMYGPKTDDASTPWGLPTPLIGSVGESNAKFYMSGNFKYEYSLYTLVCESPIVDSGTVVSSHTDDIVIDPKGIFTYTGTTAKNFIFEYCIYPGVSIGYPLYIQTYLNGKPITKDSINPVINIIIPYNLNAYNPGAICGKFLLSLENGNTVDVRIMIAQAIVGDTGEVQLIEGSYMMLTSVS